MHTPVRASQAPAGKLTPFSPLTHRQRGSGTQVLKVTQPEPRYPPVPSTLPRVEPPLRVLSPWPKWPRPAQSRTAPRNMLNPNAVSERDPLNLAPPAGPTQRRRPFRRAHPLACGPSGPRLSALQAARLPVTAKSPAQTHHWPACSLRRCCAPSSGGGWGTRGSERKCGRAGFRGRWCDVSRAWRSRKSRQSRPQSPAPAGLLSRCRHARLLHHFLEGRARALVFPGRERLLHRAR